MAEASSLICNIILIHVSLNFSSLLEPVKGRDSHYFSSARGKQQQLSGGEFVIGENDTMRMVNLPYFVQSALPPALKNAEVY